MKVSLNWIKEYVDLPEDLSISQLAHDLTMRTVEVEGWENPADDLRKVVIGKILSVGPHPNADRLRICQVEVGREKPLQIVCGGSNLYENELVVVAAPGSMVRWHGEGEPVEIKAGKLRGEVSEGMICAADELDLGSLFPAEEEHIIMDLTEFPGAEAGIELSDLLGLDDMILEIDNKSLTNRPDLWGHYGLARELAAIYGKELKELPNFEAPECPQFNVNIDDSQDCPRYAATVWEGLENGPSPFPIQMRLHLLEQEPKNLLVDLSNWVMLATGEPNHGFDRELLGEEIHVRRAKEGEKIKLLDGQELKLSSEDMVIANASEAVALAGIMGGDKHSIQDNTKSMVFETAIFDHSHVRKSSQRYNTRSEAEARFEKGIDIARVDQALGMMQALLAKYQPEAKITAHRDLRKVELETKKIKLDTKWLSSRLGQEVNTKEVEKLLTPLGFQLEEEGEDIVSVTVPSWRATGDVEETADLVEETARMIGYENFEAAPPVVRLASAIKEGALDLDRRIREFLAFEGEMQEVFTYPWMDEKLQRLCGQISDTSFKMSPAPAPELAHLRRSLLPGLLHAMKVNERYFEEFAIFEAGQVFEKIESELNPESNKDPVPTMRKHVAGLLFGADAWDLYLRAKGILETMPRRCSFGAFSFQKAEAPEWADRETYTAIFDQEGKQVGGLGLLSVASRDELSVRRGHAALFELKLDLIKSFDSRENEFEALPQFPQVEMDLSVLIPEEKTWAELVEEIGKRVDHIEFVDEYRGKQVPEGKRSITFRVRFGKEDGTMSAEEIEEKRQQLLKRLEKKLGAEIRSL